MKHYTLQGGVFLLLFYRNCYFHPKDSFTFYNFVPYGIILLLSWNCTKLCCNSLSHFFLYLYKPFDHAIRLLSRAHDEVLQKYLRHILPRSFRKCFGRVCGSTIPCNNDSAVCRLLDNLGIFYLFSLTGFCIFC